MYRQHSCVWEPQPGAEASANIKNQQGKFRFGGVVGVATEAVEGGNDCRQQQRAPPAVFP